MEGIVGRKQEITELERLYHSPKAEFVVVTGRRRVGKTYLIRELFKDRMAFHHTGLSPYTEEGEEKVGLNEQLQHFFHTLKRYGHKGNAIPKNWLDAFFMLEQLIEAKDDGSRQVVFIDEIPWMDTQNSRFLRAFESFVNGWALGRRNMMLIVCGSATSWIEDNFIKNQKGLYDRQTYELCLRPFTLHECEEFYDFNDISMSRLDIVEMYMLTGGIPYYMGYVAPGKSLAQNIDLIFFGKNAKLRNEFDKLFGSLFRKADDYIKIVRFLSTRRGGYSREEIVHQTGIPSSSDLTKKLESLEASCFIKKYQPFGCTKRELRYKLIDPFCLFYLKFLDTNKPTDEYFWQHNLNLPKLNAWRGLTFEDVCLAHVQQIKMALGVGNVTSAESAWNVQGDDNQKGAQIDLIIERADNVANLCEMKYVAGLLSIDKEEDMKLRARIAHIASRMKKRQNVQLTIITTYGLNYNKYSHIVQNTVTIDDLFT